MLVRIPVRLRAGKIEISTSALVNTGYEAEENEVLLPIKAAERLELYPPKGDFQEARYVAVGLSDVSVIRLPGALEVKVNLDERKTERVKATVVIAREEEVILSDHASSSLGIIILDPFKGE